MTHKETRQQKRVYNALQRLANGIKNAFIVRQYIGRQTQLLVAYDETRTWRREAKKLISPSTGGEF